MSLTTGRNIYFLFREKVKIPYNKQYIILKGAAKRRTVVVWDDYQSLAQSPTFMSLADNIVVRSMTFEVRTAIHLDKKNFINGCLAVTNV